MNWIALPDDFALQVHTLVVREYPKVALSRPDATHYIWSEHGVGYARMTITPADNHVAVTFIRPPGSRKSRPDQEFPYTEASRKPVAQAINDWIDEVKT
jgi:hypothetical protein